MIWSELERIFSHASDLPAGERAAYLDEACAGDPDARAEIEAMLAADQTAYEMDLERRLLPEADLGQTVGPYRIVEPLGEGGMSSVFVAERADGAYEHRVALKIVGSGIGEAEMGRRFRQERQILARLQHPNIARLLDGGGTGTGRPYLVMELVDGEPITTYCDRHRLSVNERLRLFMAVAQTVQYAHQNLIVHRDLKPSNILVTETGRVKLLDFGIAKLLDPGEGELLQTGAEHRLLTPAYAAPEQIRGDAITTATDVYALGLLLYELLSGHRPFKAGETSSRRDLESMILDAEPERPSDAIHRTGDTAVTTAVIAEARGIDSDQLHARL
ncbi:MAG: serine/threonine-protein kinase, partial [Bacteroidota bacterium]